MPVQFLRPERMTRTPPWIQSSIDKSIRSLSPYVFLPSTLAFCSAPLFFVPLSDPSPHLSLSFPFLTLPRSFFFFPYLPFCLLMPTSRGGGHGIAPASDPSAGLSFVLLYDPSALLFLLPLSDPSASLCQQAGEEDAESRRRYLMAKYAAKWKRFAGVSASGSKPATVSERSWLRRLLFR